jgi:hypothetical protein
MGEQEQVPRSNRFSARHIWNAHFKGLKNRNFGGTAAGVADVFARAVLYGAPVALAALAYWRGATIAAVDGLLVAAGVLAGGLFMAFTQVAAWRDRYTERWSRRETSEKPQRYSLDETVAHILMATYGCFALLVIVLVGANFANDDGDLVGVFSALAIAVGAYIVLLMLIILPKLYTAYAVTHELDDEMSGLSH